jgi:hypothetical protein
MGSLINFARAVFLLPVVAWIFCSAAQADVITTPTNCSDIVAEIGEVDVLTDPILLPEETCRGPIRGVRLTAIVADWEASELPLKVAVKRDRTGYRLFLLSMIEDRQIRHACWLDQPLNPMDTKFPKSTWQSVARAFERWITSCSVTQTVGLEHLRQRFSERERDFEKAFVRLARERASRFGPPEEGIAVGSFLPKSISQGILHAIADTCGVPRDRVTLRPDLSISWVPDRTQPYGADGSRPAETCVDDQIKYFPGYPKRD